MHWNIILTLIPAFIGAITALILKPFVDSYIVRIRDTRVFYSHMSDRIRDFRESIAVLDSIMLLRRDVFPIDAHIDKIAIPSHLITARAIDLGNLDTDEQKEGIRLSNQLENISRETKSINASKSAKNEKAYYTQIYELSDKMRNLAKDWENRHPKIKDQISKSDERRKLIMYEDGEKISGVAFTHDKPDRLPD